MRRSLIPDTQKAFVQFKVTLFTKDHSPCGICYVPPKRIYKALCPDGIEACKATVRMFAKRPTPVKNII